MASEWRDYQLAEICEEKIGIQTGPFGSQLHKKDYVLSGTPIITVEHLADNRITTQNLPLVSDEDKKRLQKYQLQTGDIVFSRVGSVDRRSLVRENENGWLFSGRCLRVRVNRTIAVPEFVSFQMGTENFKNCIRSVAVGATMPSINTKILSEISIRLPSIDEQKAIAEVLLSLDDKIELNRRMNATLEAMARALFKDWFVDFGPTRAKMALGGEEPQPEKTSPTPYLSSEIWSLFPDRLDDSGNPKGWETSNIASEVKILGGGTPSTKEPAFWEGGIYNWCTPKDLSHLTSPVLLDTNRKITEKGLEKISSGLLPKGCILMSSRAPVGYLAIAEIPTAVNQGFIAMRCSKNISNLYILFWCKANMEKIKNSAGGTTFAEINKSTFGKIPIICPSAKSIMAFDKLVGPLFSRVVCNLKENRTLAAMRDLLLPKLMSGEIRVKDAEKIAEKAP